MGNRVNYGFVAGPENEIFYLYLHWGPEDIETVLAEALDKTRKRWGDQAYAIRWTILNIMDSVGELDPTSEVGSGFTVNYLSDNEHPVWVVDFPRGTVSNEKVCWEIDKFVENYKS